MMPATVGFDYSGLAPETSEALKGLVERGNEARSRIALNFIEFGRVLIDGKKLVPRRFQRWVRAEFGLSPRTAEHHMAVARGAERVASKCANFAHWPRTVLAMIGGKTVPDDVWQREVHKYADTESVPKISIFAQSMKSGRVREQIRLLSSPVPNEPSQIVSLTPSAMNSTPMLANKMLNPELHGLTRQTDNLSNSSGVEAAFASVLAWLIERAEADDLEHLARMLQRCGGQKTFADLAGAIKEELARSAPNGIH
jgi:hypothetical protein